MAVPVGQERELYDLILRDATIVTSAGREVADVAIKNDKIAYVGARPPRRAREEIKAIGKFLMPGVIDTAVQFAPTKDMSIWAGESAAAATGGVTTVVCLPGGEQPVVDSTSASKRIKAINGHSHCHFALWGGAGHDNAPALQAAARKGLIVGALACIGKDTGEVVLDPEELDKHIGIEGVLGVRSSNEDPDSQVIDSARKRERGLHIVHLSTAKELHLLDPVRGDLPVTAGVTAHHLFLSQEGLNGRASDIATTPPVRPEHDRRTLWTAMKRGRLDCVASDHHPTRPGEVGIPGSELLFPLMLSAVKYGRLSLELLVSLCSEAPARIFGLENKGRIERGADADMVLFSEGDLTRVAEGELLSAAGWSPYSDREAATKPDLVIIGGRIVAQRGQLIDEQAHGTFVRGPTA